MTAVFPGYVLYATAGFIDIKVPTDFYFENTGRKSYLCIGSACLTHCADTKPGFFFFPRLSVFCAALSNQLLQSTWGTLPAVILHGSTLLTNLDYRLFVRSNGEQKTAVSYSFDP